MPALQGTIALPQMDDVAMAVGEDLHLDVARLFDVLFQVNAAVLEGLLRFLPGRLEARFQAHVIAGHAHAASAAAGRRLDQHRVADLIGECERLGLLGDQAVAAGDDGHAGLAGRSCGPRSCCRVCASLPAAGR